MSRMIEIPSDTSCFLCDSLFAQSSEIYVAYKCFCCINITAYCLQCDTKMRKLLGQGTFFKCVHCNKLTNAIDKIELAPPNSLQANQIPDNNLNLSNALYKTPIKPFLSNNNAALNSIKQLPSALKENNGEESKDNSLYSNKHMLNNFISDFNNINLTTCSKNIDENQKIPANYKFLNNKNNRHERCFSNQSLVCSTSQKHFMASNDFSLLKNKNRINKLKCINDTLLQKKRDDSLDFNQTSVFKGYNKSKEKNNSIFGSTKPKKIMSRLQVKAGENNNESISQFNICNTENNVMRSQNNLFSNVENGGKNNLFGFKIEGNDIFSEKNKDNSELFGKNYYNDMEGIKAKHKFY